MSTWKEDLSWPFQQGIKLLVNKDTDKETELGFFRSPVSALFDVSCSIQARPKYKVIKDSFEKAVMIYEENVFTERENAIAASFFELGVAYITTIALNDQEYRKAPHIKAGKKSPWSVHEDVIVDVLSRYERDRKFSQKEARRDIELRTGKELALSTFNNWLKKYRKEKCIFSK